VEVADSGTGMSPEIQNRIFEPFFTTKEMGRGVGLGLASVYGIVKGHAGFIQVHSTLGKGSTFSVYLPVAADVAEEENKEAEKGRIVEGQGTILFIDDEELIRFVASRMLEKLGYKVLTAASGQEGIDLYRQKNDGIHLVILDMIMPQMNGGEAFDHLAAIHPKVKVLLASGYSIDGEAKNILARGCKGFIQKPFSLKDLSEKIREALAADP
jgi:CheY-like chemotaxis protein